MPTKQEYKDEAAMTTNLAYMVADMLESAIIDMQCAMEQSGLPMRFDQKRKWNALKNACTCVLNDIKHLDTQIKSDFGNDCDCHWVFMKTLISRTGSDYLKLYQFFQYLKSYPAQISFPNLDRDENRAFKFLFNRHDAR